MARIVREHVRPLSSVPDADILVRLTTDHTGLVAYAVALRVHIGAKPRTVRLYDYVPTHGAHHMHRYTAKGAKRQPPEVRRFPTVQAGFDDAISQIRASGGEMIDSWRRQKPTEA